MDGVYVMKILYVTTVGGTMNFFKNFIEQLVNLGNTVDIACNDSISIVPEFFRNLGCKIYPICTSRVPLNKDNIIAIRQIQKLVKDKKYDIVHCHTPVAAACTRLACCKIRKQGTRVFYTVHGFHFYKGAPLKNWLVYYPIEKLCAYLTDVLITINKEDYDLAKKKMKAKRVEYVPGVGIDLQKFDKVVVDKEEKRKELGIPQKVKWILNVGELISRKNQETLIRAVAEMEDVYLTIAGSGVLLEFLTDLIKELGIDNRVKLLGYRKDIVELCKACDIFAFPSFQEGLPVSLMEAMASGLPIVCSRIRGNIDLIDENGGVLFNPYSVIECKNMIEKLFESDVEKFGLYNMQKIGQFSLEKVNEQMIDIIEDIFLC